MTESLTPKTRRTRARLLQMTADIISREGYSAWNEDYLCERCECTRGTLRYQFPQGKYDLFPALIRFALDQDAGVVESMGISGSRERMYLILSSLSLRPPSNTTIAMLEIWMAARGDLRLYQCILPLLSGAHGNVLGIGHQPEDQTPEIQALLHILLGACLNSMRSDFNPESFRASLRWLLSCLPVPPDVGDKLAALIKARSEQKFEQS